MIEANPQDILGAVHAFISELVWPQPELIVRGWQNTSSLPDDTDYAVITLSQINRQGTNAHQYAYGQLTGFAVKTRFMNIFDIQIDFCGLNEQAVFERAARVGLLARDRIGSDFFKTRRLACLYADDPRALPFTGDGNQWVVRYSIDLHLCGWIEQSSAIPAFESVNLHLENVDVHHPVKTGNQQQEKI